MHKRSLFYNTLPNPFHRFLKKKLSFPNAYSSLYSPLKPLHANGASILKKESYSCYSGIHCHRTTVLTCVTLCNILKFFLAVHISFCHFKTQISYYH